MDNPRRGGRGKKRGRPFSTYSQKGHDNAQQGGAGGGPPRPPPGLKGRDIGMWYAHHGGKRKAELDKKERPMITMNSDMMKSILDICDQLDDSAAALVKEEPMNTSYHELPSASGVSQPSTSRVKQEPGLFVKQEAQQIDLVDADGDDVIEIGDMVGEGGIGSDQNPLFQPQKLKPDPAFESDAKTSLNRLREFRKGSKFAEFQQNLPINEQKADIINLIENNPVTVISGETGSGKSTQVPQYILDTAIEKGKASETYIVVTQPRRISAMSLAARVSEERGEKLGESVGYQIRLEARAPRNRGSILFCTYGIVLRWLHGDPDLSRVSHIVMDEVHERDIHSDFTLIIIRDILRRRPELKIVLMSATLDADLFSKYFFDAPRINIPGVIFPVKQFYLEEVIEKLKYWFPPRAQIRHGRMPREYQDMADKSEAREAYKAHQAALSKWKHDNRAILHANTLETVMNWDESVVELDIIVVLVRAICRERPSDEAVLIFLPGWADISKLLRLLRAQFPVSDAAILPLHSLLPQLDQQKIFNRPTKGVRKIVVATNIAETSITIDDVVHVIDCGKIKMTQFDEKNNISTLKPEWVSKANARQRRGRAGRVKPGFAYHLFTSVRNEMLEQFLLPEMKRVRVENLILQMKLLRLGKVKKFLAKAPEPPSERSVELALEELIAIGAVEEESEELTSLGWHLARLPVEPHCGKMIVYGAMFSCLQPILTIASCLDYKDPFNTPMGMEQQVDRKKVELAGDHCISDHLLWWKVVREMDQMPAGLAGKFAYDNFVSFKTVNFIRKLTRQYAQVLCDAGFLSSADPEAEEANANSSCEEIISAVVCAGLYPNVAESIPNMARYDRGCTFKPNPKTGWKNLKPHLSSVVASRPKVPTRYVVFHKVMRSSSVFMYDCGMVSPLSLCIFAGSMKHVKAGGDSYVELDNWIRFYCSKDVIQVIELLRNEFDGILKRRIENPQPVVGTISGVWVPTRMQLEELMMSKVVGMLLEEQFSFKHYK